MSRKRKFDEHDISAEAEGTAIERFVRLTVLRTPKGKKTGLQAKINRNVIHKLEVRVLKLHLTKGSKNDKG